jgi:hypothetical protein
MVEGVCVDPFWGSFCWVGGLLRGICYRGKTLMARYAGGTKRYLEVHGEIRLGPDQPCPFTLSPQNCPGCNDEGSGVH